VVIESRHDGSGQRDDSVARLGLRQSESQASYLDADLGDLDPTVENINPVSAQTSKFADPKSSVRSDQTRA
jgi:hypothetical protein